MSGDHLQLSQSKAKYWIRRMIKAADGVEAVGAALGVTPSMVSRWGSPNYVDLPHVRYLVELIQISGEFGLLLEMNRLCGTEAELRKANKRLAIIEAAVAKKYDDDADEMLDLAGGAP